MLDVQERCRDNNFKDTKSADRRSCMSEVPLRPYDIGSDASTEGGPETPEEIPDFARSLEALVTLSEVLAGRFERLGRWEDAKNSIRCQQLMIVMATHHGMDEIKPLAFENFAALYTSRYQRLGSLLDIDKAIDHRSKAVMLTPDDNDGKPALLNNLGVSYQHRFERLGELADIDKSIECWKQAMHLIPDGHGNKLAFLHNLGSSYSSRFKLLGVPEDSAKAIECANQALLLTPDNHIDQSDRLAILGTDYARRYTILGELADIDQAIEYHTRAIELMPDGYENKPNLLVDLGSSYACRFRHLGKLMDIERAIDCQNEAVLLAPDDHENFPGLLNNLAISYPDRFQRLGNLPDIDLAISHHSRALLLTPGGHSDKSFRLNSFGISLMRRFDYLGDSADIIKAIGCLIEAVTLTPDGHLEKPGRLSCLGISYMRRFECLDQLSDINRAIECQSEAVMLSADGHMEKPTLLNNLGSSFLQRFRRLGDLADIDKSIKCHSQAILLVPNGHENKATLLSDLGNSYQHRFRRLSEVVDIDKAIKFQIESVQLTPQGHSSMPVRLRNLGSSYASRFNRLGDIKDLERAIEHQSEAVVLTPDHHANMPTLLDDLGGSYMDRFKCLGELTDINNAIQYKNQAVVLTPDSHVDKPGWLNNLGGAYIRRFQRQRELEDINKAIEYFNHAVQLIPNGHAFRPVVLNNLGESYLNRCVLQEERTDAEIASSFYQEAAQLEVTDPTAQLRAARGWAACSSALSISPQLAYQRAMELVPQLVWLGTTIDKRYETLTEVGNIAVEAAAWALSSQAYELALEWLEEGRSIVWNQILQLRTPFDELSTANPTLAKRLMEVSRELEQAGSRSNSTSSPKNAVVDSSLEQQAERHHSLAAEWSQLLSQARDLPGFHNFLRPRKAKELLGAAKNGPVVVVNVHSRRCDALILMPGNNGIDHIPLKDFTIEKADESRAHLLSFIEHRGLRSRGMVLKPPKSTSKPEQQLKAMLATLWSDVVKPVLDFLKGVRGPRGDEPQDVTWCTTGPLSFLPLHAAGCYDGVQPNAFDLVVSSYTPTLGALLDSNPSVFNPDSGVLAVGQDYKNSPGSLPNTIQELATIREYATSTRYMQLDGENATVEAVLNAMDEFSWVHLACHASQHKDDPSQSAFQLYDGNLMLSMITKREFKNKGLAFLSACQTATGDEKLPDEAVHLAAGMLMAGYPSVIATMWGIGDKDAPKVSRHVYAELLKDGKLGSKGAARALHRAVSSLREEVGQNAFERWVPFIHIGV